MAPSDRSQYSGKVEDTKEWRIWVGETLVEAAESVARQGILIAENARQILKIRDTQEEIKTILTDHGERISKQEGKLENGINAVVKELHNDVKILTANQWKIVWRVLGGMTALGTAAGAIVIVAQAIS